MARKNRKWMSEDKSLVISDSTIEKIQDWNLFPVHFNEKQYKVTIEWADETIEYFLMGE